MGGPLMDRTIHPDDFLKGRRKTGKRTISGGELMGMSFPPLTFIIPRFVTPGSRCSAASRSSASPG